MFNDDIANIKRDVGEPCFNGAIFSVVRHKIELDHATISRQVVKKPSVVHVAVHNLASDRWLVTCEYRAGANECLVGFPAGTVHDGEREGALDAARRELQEETGIWFDADDADNRIVQVNDMPFFSSPGFTNEEAYLFIIELGGRLVQGEQQLDADENIAFSWRAYDELINTSMQGSNDALLLAMIRLRYMQREIDGLTRRGSNYGGVSW